MTGMAVHDAIAISKVTRRATAAALAIDCLCWPLIKHLQAQPDVDDPSAECLLKAKQAIETVLDRHQARKEIPKNGNEAAVGEKRTFPVAPLPREDLFCSAEGKQPIVRVSPYLSQQVERKREDKEEIPFLPSIMRTTHPAQRRVDKKGKDGTSVKEEREVRSTKKAMMPIRPYTDLTDEESRLTVMERFWGKGAYLWCKRLDTKREIRVSIFTFSVVLNTLLASLYVSMPLGTIETGVVISCMMLTTALQLCLYAYLANFYLFVTTLWTFEALMILIESLLFTAALAGVFCFSLSGWLYAFTGFMHIAATFGFYDSYPSEIRKDGRAGFAMLCLFALSLMMVIYLRIPPHMCLYRVDLEQGLQDENNPDYVPSVWSLSVLEFCLNRGFSTGMLLLRLTYTVLKYPQDCVVIRSRIRILEDDKRCQTSSPASDGATLFLKERQSTMPPDNQALK